MFDFENFLKEIIEMGISDIHLRANEVPVVRKDGVIIKTHNEPLTKEILENIVENILPLQMKFNLNEIYNYDFLYEIPNVSRFRVNYAKNLENPMLVLRVVPYVAPDFENKNIPKVLQKVCAEQNGIVFVTGPTGSGKSTTLAAMLQYINENYAKHIITLEDPVEFIYTNDKSIFSQRQIGLDAQSYPDAVKASLRQDPDIILIGEIRDRNTAKEALSAAETGHLVFTTLHTSDAVQTVNRIVNFFEPHERDQVRNQLANVLRATITQKLLPKKDNTGRIPAFEILIATPSIKDYIIKGQLEKIYSLIKEGKYSDMMPLNMYLSNLVKLGLISEEVAFEASENKNEIQQIFKGAYHTTFNKKQ